MRFLPRSLFAGLFIATVTLTVQATEFAWAGRGTITFDLPPGWELNGRQIGGGGAFAFDARPKSDAPAVLRITLANTPSDRPLDPAKLATMLEEMVRNYVDGSVEKRFAPQPLPLAQGRGLYVQFTDAALVGHPAQRENLKVMRNAIAALDDHALAIITLQFDDPAAPELSAMMGIVRHMRFQRAAAPQRSLGE